VQLQLAQSVAPRPDRSRDTDPGQLPGLARFKRQLLQPPGLGAALRAHAWPIGLGLVVAMALAAFGLVQSQPVWLVLGVVAPAAAFAAVFWTQHSAHPQQRRLRLQRQFALGNWDAVRVLAQGLRRISVHQPDLAFDLDLRLAGIVARDHGLDEALARLEPWRARWSHRPGVFEQGVAMVHHMAGDTAGYVSQTSQARALDPGNPVWRIDAALAQARFGSPDQADAWLAGIDATELTPAAAATAQWARALVQLRRRQPDAVPALGVALAAWLTLSTQPATWPAVALCTCDLAIAQHQAGDHDTARAHIAAVWPVLEVHASAALLRMLEADDLLPVRSTPNT
jgi:hypothetical protein